MKKINQYLLTRYPLLWNTRIVWVLLANCIIHFLFFALGFASLSVKTIKEFTSVWAVGGGSLITFSVLCSLLVIIVWLIYFLRNNAFKVFYRIDKWHLAKEFAIILLLFFTSITYFEAYNFGVRLRARSITSQAELVKETNQVNRAMAFIPKEKEEYFILNNCEARRTSDIVYNINIDSSIIPSAQDTVTIKVRNALRRPDAFSFKNYCARFFDQYHYKNLTGRESLAEQRNRWIDAHNTDSIRDAINDLISVCRRYDIDLSLNSDALAKDVFAKPYTNIDSLIPTAHYRQDASGNTIENTYFIYTYDLSRVIDFLDECHASRSAAIERRSGFTVESYLAICATILLLCYRRFSRKVFLISVVGTIVWAILIGLIMAVMRGEGTSFSVICLSLCMLFLFIGWANLRSKTAKTMTGILLSWHSFLVPFVIMFLMMIISDYYVQQQRMLQNLKGNDDMAPGLYPFSYWVHTHESIIVLVNLPFVILYIAFVFNQLAKRWQEQAEE